MFSTNLLVSVGAEENFSCKYVDQKTCIKLNYGATGILDSRPVVCSYGTDYQNRMVLDTVMVWNRALEAYSNSTDWNIGFTGEEKSCAIKVFFADSSTSQKDKENHVLATTSFHNGMHGTVAEVTIFTTYYFYDDGRHYVTVNDGSGKQRIVYENGVPRYIEIPPFLLQKIITHELGHAIGLPHSSNPDDIMYLQVQEHGFKKVTLDDYVKLTKIYPDGWKNESNSQSKQK